VPKTCNNCGVVGHLAGSCPEPSQCHACGSTTHEVAECPNREKTCDNCGKVSASRRRAARVCREVGLMGGWACERGDGA
jgi:cellular nucleic acid-binding protein